MPSAFVPLFNTQFNAEPPAGRLLPRDRSIASGAGGTRKGIVWAAENTAALDQGEGVLRVPGLASIGSASLEVQWSINITTGNVRWDLSYRAIGNGEDANPSTWQQTVDSGSLAVPGTAHLLTVTSTALTAANFAPGDIVKFLFGRNNTIASNAAAHLLFESAGIVFST